jgi:hypothetical protein
MQFNYSGTLPLVPLVDILRIDSNKYSFTLPINPLIFTDIDTKLVLAVLPAKRKRESAITCEEFKQVIDLHELTCHTSPNKMSTNIRLGAWTNVTVLPSTIDRVFRKHDCLICAQAKWNNPTVQSGTGIAVQHIGQVVSIDRVPITQKCVGGYTGFYLVSERSVAYSMAFLDKTNSLMDVIVKIILYFRKWGFDVQIVRTDAGSKETSNAFKNLLAHYHARLEPAISEQQYQNPVERYVQYFKPNTAALLASQTNLGQEFWCYALLASIYAWNCSVNSLSGDYSPLYYLTNKHPDINETFKYRFGQQLIIHKSGQHGANFDLKNELGYNLGPTEFANRSSLVYIPSRPLQKFFIRSYLAPVTTLAHEKLMKQQSVTSPVIYIDESSALTSSQVNSSIPNIDANHVVNLETNKAIPRRSIRLAAIKSVYHLMIDRGSMFVINGVSHIQDDNPTIGQALKSVNRREWIRAIFKELINLETHKTWRKITRAELNGLSPLHCKLVLRKKRVDDTRKARIVILGNHDYSILGNVFAPTANQASVLLLLAIVVFYRLKVKGYDVYGAFLIPKQKRRVVIVLPKEATPGYFAQDFSSDSPEFHEFKEYLLPASDNNTDEGLRELLTTMYGQSDSPKEFYEHVAELLIGHGYTRSTYDPCIFFRRPSSEAFIMVVVHVDDFLVAASDDSLINHVETTFRTVYKITVSDTVESYLGMRIDYNSDSSIKVSNPLIIKELIEKTQMDEDIPATTPMRADFNDDYQDDSELLSANDKQFYQEVLGSLIFIVKTRPDIAYAVNRLATRTLRATNKDKLAILRVVRYLKGTLNLGLTFRSVAAHHLQDYIQLVLYADAAYITHRDGKSHSGMSLHLVEAVENPHLTMETAPISASSVKQPNVSLSSTEAEIEPVVEGVKTGLWITNLLKEMDLNIREPLIIYEDNLSAIQLATQFSGNHRRTKHYLVRIGFLMEQFRRHLVRYIHVETHEQIADILTKPLGEADFVRLRNQMLG